MVTLTRKTMGMKPAAMKRTGFKGFEGDGKVAVKIIEPGQGATGFYTPEVLAQAAMRGLFDNVPIMRDHVHQDGIAPEHPSIKNLVGWINPGARYVANHPDGPGVYGTARIRGPQREDVYSLVRSPSGMSIHADGDLERPGDTTSRVIRIDKVKSVDMVIKPGAGGAITEVLESLREEGVDAMGLYYQGTVLLESEDGPVATKVYEDDNGDFLTEDELNEFAGIGTIRRGMQAGGRKMVLGGAALQKSTDEGLRGKVARGVGRGGIEAGLSVQKHPGKYAAGLGLGALTGRKMLRDRAKEKKEGQVQEAVPLGALAAGAGVGSMLGGGRRKEEDRNMLRIDEEGNVYNVLGNLDEMDEEELEFLEGAMAEEEGLDEEGQKHPRLAKALDKAAAVAGTSGRRAGRLGRAAGRAGLTAGAGYGAYQGGKEAYSRGKGAMERRRSREEEEGDLAESIRQRLAKGAGRVADKATDAAMGAAGAADRYGKTGGRVAGGLAAGGALAGGGYAAGTNRERLGGMASAGRERAGEMAGSAREKARTMASSARGRFRRGGRDEEEGENMQYVINEETGEVWANLGADFFEDERDQIIEELSARIESLENGESAAEEIAESANLAMTFGSDSSRDVLMETALQFTSDPKQAAVLGKAFSEAISRDRDAHGGHWSTWGLPKAGGGSWHEFVPQGNPGDVGIAAFHGTGGGNVSLTEEAGAGQTVSAEAALLAELTPSWMK